MQYRKMGSLDWEVSALGFGCMRLPTVRGSHDRIDERTVRANLLAGTFEGETYDSSGSTMRRPIRGTIRF